MNVLSLFDGIRTGHLALENAGINVDRYYSSEIDEKAIMIGDKNFPQDIKYKLGDINNITPDVLRELPKIDLIMFGSPCQGFSRNGNMLNFEDPRSKLFFNAVNIMNWLKENNNPEIKFMMENVEMKKEWVQLINETLGVKGVLINSKLLSAQNRPRMYWTNIVEDLQQPIDLNIKLIDILDDVSTDKFILKDGLLFDNQFNEKAIDLVNVVNNEVRVSQATKLGYIVANNGDGVNLQFPTSKTRRGRVVKSKSNTLDCACDGAVYYNGVVRKFTTNELEKLQTLPLNYTLVDGIGESARRKGIGNGWTCSVITYILKQING